TILDMQYLDECGVDLAHASVSTTTGVDETGHEWTRHWSTIAGKIHLKGAPETAQPEPRVQFQEIIHDGLVGTDYLERYRATLDTPGGRHPPTPRSARGPPHPLPANHNSGLGRTTIRARIGLSARAAPSRWHA